MGLIPPPSRRPAAETMNAPEPFHKAHPETTPTAAERPAARLKALGALAHQLTASVRAADRFLGAGDPADRESAGWLMSSAQALSVEVTAELDALARDARSDASGASGNGTALPWARWRMLAHRLQATCRAADRYLEDERAEDRETGAWLVLTAQRQSAELAAALDDALATASAGRAVGEPVPVGSGSIGHTVVMPEVADRY